MKWLSSWFLAHISRLCVSTFCVRLISSVVSLQWSRWCGRMRARSHSISSSRSLIISLFAHFMSICALLTIAPICVRFGSFHVLFQCFIYYCSYNAWMFFLLRRRRRLYLPIYVCIPPSVSCFSVYTPATRIEVSEYKMHVNKCVHSRHEPVHMPEEYYCYYYCADIIH